MRSTITVIDFGTSKVVALVAEVSGRQRTDIIGAGIAPYDGFADARWNNPDMVNDAIAQVEARGGSAPSSVLKTLDYLVIGDADFEKFQGGWRSSKLKQAEKHNDQGSNIQIIGEQAFLKLLDN